MLLSLTLPFRRASLPLNSSAESTNDDVRDENEYVTPADMYVRLLCCEIPVKFVLYPYNEFKVTRSESFGIIIELSDTTSPMSQTLIFLI